MTPHELRDDDGFVLVTAVILLFIMLVFAVASLSLVDLGQGGARRQRERETSFNLAEGVLYSQGLTLAQHWPGNLAAAAIDCSQASSVSLCPSPAALAAANSSAMPTAASFTNVDASANVTWTTKIRDNGGPLAGAFDPAQVDVAQTGTNAQSGAAYTCAAPCRWDADGDGQVWAEARAVVRGKPRVLVALLKRQRFPEAFPHNAVTSGSFVTTNSGNKTIIDSTGSQVVVRCDPTLPACAGYTKAQVPGTIVGAPTYPPALTAAQLVRFKAAAQAASPSSYYTACPAAITGTIVYIDVPAATDCSPPIGTDNSATSPGIVIMPRGTLGGTGGGWKVTYYGLVYLGNLQDLPAAGYQSSGPVLTLGANTKVIGGVAVDGPGQLVVGQASGNSATITFWDGAFSSLATFGTTSLSPNTFRELPPATP